jgi:uncharacterized protein (TIGR03067 family)
MRTVWACGLVAAMVVAATAAVGGDAKSDQAKLQGKWVRELNGQKGELKFDKSAFVLTLHAKGEVIKGTFKIDPSKTPKEMDLTITESDDPKEKGQAFLAIYAVDGDTLKICTGEPGHKRPAAFLEKEGEDSGNTYVVFKRAK